MNMLRYVVFLRQKSRENQEYVDKFYATMQLRKSKLNIHSPMDQVFSVTEDYLINDMPWVDPGTSQLILDTSCLTIGYSSANYRFQDNLHYLTVFSGLPP